MRCGNKGSNFIVFIVSSLLLSAILMTSACEPVTQVRGTVRDKNGSPISEVNIAMYSSGETQGTEKKKESEQKTDSSGKFNFVSITPEAKKISLTFKKEGYVTVEKEIQPNGSGSVDIVLETAAK